MYDAFGRLIERQTSGSSTTTNRMYYAGWQSVAEYDGSGTLQTKYVYGPGIDEPIRSTHYSPVTTQYYFHADALGSITEITDATSALTEQYRYDVYGQPTILAPDSSILTSSSIGNRLLFTGRDRDPDTGLYNYRMRYYSPSLGRFVQPDPISIAGGDLNIYRYVGNNPVNHTDSVGLGTVLVVIGIVVVIGLIFWDLYKAAKDTEKAIDDAKKAHPEDPIGITALPAAVMIELKGVAGIGLGGGGPGAVAGGAPETVKDILAEVGKTVAIDKAVDKTVSCPTSSP